VLYDEYDGHEYVFDKGRIYTPLGLMMAEANDTTQRDTWHLCMAEECLACDMLLYARAATVNRWIDHIALHAWRWRFQGPMSTVACNGEP
jgi:hypothetical protein